MQRRVIGSFLFLLMTLPTMGCPSIVETAMKKRQEDENRKLLQERTSIDKVTDRNNYKSDQAYRRAYLKQLNKYKDLARKNIDSATYQYLYGYLLVDKQKKVRQYTECLKIDVKNFWCVVGRGLVYAQWGVENFARKDYTIAKSLRPDSYKPTLILAALAFKKRRNQQAIKHYEAILAKQSDNKEALSNLALLYDREGEWKPAIKYYNKTLKSDPKDFASWRALSRIHLRLKNYPKAAESMEKAIGIRSNFRLIVQLAGLYEKFLANPAKAETLYERASKLPQVHFHTYYRLGVLRGQRGEFTSGILALQRAVKLRNDNPEAFFQLAQLHVRKDEHKQAIPIFWKALRLNGKMVKARQALAESMIATKEYADALRQYQEILNQNPKNQTVRNNMNRLLNRLGLTNDTFTARTNGRVIKKGEKIIYRCFKQRQKEKPKLKGTVAVSMIVASDGKVERVGINITKTTLNDPLVQTCVRWTFRRAIFPKIRRRSRLRYKVRLR